LFIETLSDGRNLPAIAFLDRQGMVQAQYEGMDPFFGEERMARNLHDRIAAFDGATQAARRRREGRPEGRDPAQE